MLISDLTSVWESGNITLDALDKNKILKDIYILSKYPVNITLNSDKSSKTLTSIGQDKIQRVGVNLPGKEFSFKLGCDTGNLHIENVQLRFKVED